MTRVKHIDAPSSNNIYRIEFPLELTQEVVDEIDLKFDCIRGIIHETLVFCTETVNDCMQDPEWRNLSAVISRLERNFDSLSESNLAKYRRLNEQKDILDQKFNLAPEVVKDHVMEVVRVYEHSLCDFEVDLVIADAFMILQRCHETGENIDPKYLFESYPVRFHKGFDDPGLHLENDRLVWSDTARPDFVIDLSYNRDDAKAVRSFADKTIDICLCEKFLEDEEREFSVVLTKRRSNSRPQKSAQVRQVPTEDPQDRIRHFEELIVRQKKQIRKVEKAIDRSMRTYNASSFDEKGKYIKGAPLLVSNNCQEHKDRLAKLNRKLQGNIQQLEKLKVQAR